MKTTDARPILAITQGDPAGIGPEIILKALAHDDLFARCRPLVIGDRRIFERATPWVGREGIPFETVTAPEGGQYAAGTVPMLDLADVVVVNKSDRAGAITAQNEVEQRIRMNRRSGKAQQVMTTCAKRHRDGGVDALFETLIE